MPRTRFKIVALSGAPAKECALCSVVRALDNFPHLSNGLGRRRSVCKTCWSRRDKAREATPAKKLKRRREFEARYYAPDAIVRRELRWARKEAPFRQIAADLGKEFITRVDAIRMALPRYFVGVVCPKGHLADRITFSRACEVCRSQVAANYHKKHKERLLAKKQAAYLKNVEAERAESRAYRAANPEKIKASRKRWTTNNPESYRAAARKQNNLRRGDRGTHTAEDIQQIERQQRGRCAYCRVTLKSVKRHVDHIMPLSRGGTGIRSNLQLLCQRCNNKKHAKDPIIFARQLGMLL